MSEQRRRGDVVTYTVNGQEYSGTVLYRFVREGLGEEAAPMDLIAVLLQGQRCPISVRDEDVIPVVCSDCGCALNIEDSDGKSICRGCWLANHRDVS